MEKGELSEEAKNQVNHAAIGRMLDLLAEDDGVSEIAKENPDEVVRIFLAGCQAGAESLNRIIQLGLRKKQ